MLALNSPIITVNDYVDFDSQTVDQKKSTVTITPKGALSGRNRGNFHINVDDVNANMTNTSINLSEK